MNSEQIGKNIKLLRIKHKLTQKEFADKLGVTYQAVSKWENGKNMPDILLLKDISSLFNIDIDELLIGKRATKYGNITVWIIGGILLLIIVILVISIFLNDDSEFQFKTITSSCDEFLITGSAAYNKKKSSIYISDVDYCGKENNIIYKSFDCSLYEEYENTKTKIGACGYKSGNLTLEEFLDTIQINVNNYVASCKMFKSSLLYMEISAVGEDDLVTTYQIPINLEDNCKQ